MKYQFFSQVIIDTFLLIESVSSYVFHKEFTSIEQKIVLETAMSTYLPFHIAEV